MDATNAIGTPLVSAIVPAYNAAVYIERTLESLVAQTYPNMEIVVVDDGSTDGTVRCVEALAERHTQIRLVQQANSGVAAARNRGIQESRGEFIAPVDADDIWFPEAAAKLARCLVEAGPEVGVAYGWWVNIDENSLLDGRYRCSEIEGDVLATLICHNFLGNASSTMIRRACFDKVGDYESSFRNENAEGCEDWDLYLRIAREYQFKVVPEFLIGYRKLNSGLTGNLAAMAASHQKVLDRIRARHPDLPAALWRLSNSSFNLYLANESYYRGQPRQAMRWLRQALVDAPAFTLLRVVFYELALKNSAAIVGALGDTARARLGLPARTTRWTSGRRVSLEEIKRKRSDIALRTITQNMLHRIVGRLRI